MPVSSGGQGFLDIGLCNAVNDFHRTDVVDQNEAEKIGKRGGMQTMTEGEGDDGGEFDFDIGF